MIHLVTLLCLLGCFHWCNIFQRINLQYPSFTSIISQKSINQSILTWSIGVIFFPQMLWMAFVVSAMSLTKYTSCGEQDRWLSCLLVFDPIKAVLLWLVVFHFVERDDLSLIFYSIFWSCLFLIEVPHVQHLPSHPPLLYSIDRGMRMMGRSKTIIK